MQVVVPMATTRWRTRRVAVLRSKQGDDQLRQPFELDGEYEALLYRQFIVLIAQVLRGRPCHTQRALTCAHPPFCLSCLPRFGFQKTAPATHRALTLVRLILCALPHDH